ncbi:3-hydroxyacyl-CoA dehydrogenase family protein [Calderihabitans maritimus]|uniref:3-hydroxybutyryl-CoA dehydrogenase n=1 Tax=Calderihabitans maritimus TaxID=1246530 RepID=A0A1Z5HX05_9FIRM|nr:3-hydroxyacyl-CoA dehydrogenase family protein [Calderihabitans maritimus]GAW93810.1 3-hydroxybutyryl-CoA dehydrogenase [Calderihabitans maritimus]
MIKTIFVVGAGLMGSGIAQVAAQGGYRVVMHDLNDQILQKGMESIKNSLERFAKKGKISEGEVSEIINRIETTTDLTKAAEAELVIEAVFENLEIKKDVFSKLDNICKPEAILATNTSALSITKIAAATNRPEQVVGMHFFSPVPMMKLVEIIKGVRTADTTVAIVKEVAKQMGKEPVVAGKDFGGFIANRVALPYMRMAIVVLTEGIASKEEIDQAMRLGYGFPMGPLELADLTGLDVLLHSLEGIYNDLQDPAYAPPPLLKRMVEAGLLGRKTGQGFYRYDAQGKRLPD